MKYGGGSIMLWFYFYKVLPLGCDNEYQTFHILFVKETIDSLYTALGLKIPYKLIDL